MRETNKLIHFGINIIKLLNSDVKRELQFQMAWQYIGLVSTEDLPADAITKAMVSDRVLVSIDDLIHANYHKSV